MKSDLAPPPLTDTRAPVDRNARPTAPVQGGRSVLPNGGGPSLGQVLRNSKGLTDEQIEQIVLHQRTHNLRFGESAVALNYANRDEVLWALSQQFHYPYVSKEERKFPSELVTAVSPFDEISEVFRDLRSKLLDEFFSEHKATSALAVVSPNAGDGRTFFAANLAVALSQLGARTLLVDANLRNPRLHSVFRIGNNTGLSSILMGREESNVIHQLAGLPSLYVLPAGAPPPNPIELVQRPAFGLLMHDLINRFDHVVVDTPSAAAGADSRVIAAKCGSALLVGRRDRTPMSRLEKLADGVAKSGARLAGLVINEH